TQLPYETVLTLELDEIKKELKKLLKDKKIHEVNPDNVGNVAEELHKISDGADGKSQGGRYAPRHRSCAWPGL
ncbi:MAG: hypothetical protein ACWGPN_06075, partial [Gammaproteobacteria bacterium]